MSKRLFDLTIATIGLLVLSPIFLTVAIIVWLTDGRPIWFRQFRVGLHEQHFEILKFRTMAQNSHATGLQVTVDGDSRITTLGRFLRRTKLDELPQLLNVLRGEMSLVGPRPEVPRYVAHYPLETKSLVLSVRPGITDNAAILYRNESEILANAADPERTYVEEVLPHKLTLYSNYVRSHSLNGDIAILLKTVAALFTGLSRNKSQRTSASNRSD